MPTIDRRAYLPEVAAVLGRVSALLHEESDYAEDPWALQNALYQAWIESGSSRAVLDEAQKWLLRTAAEWAQADGRITASGLAADAAEAVRLIEAEEGSDA
jgi:hypothetical protein